MAREYRTQVAEEIAREIEQSVSRPAESCQDCSCPDCIRYEQAMKDAGTARRIGREWLR